MRLELVVVYTARIEACREFYAELGLEFAAEQHGDGPPHYAAVLPGGPVFELYPAADGRAGGPMRLGFAVDARPGGPPPGRRVLRDPDGRAVEVRVCDGGAA